MNRYRTSPSRRPHWITTRYAGSCSTCKRAIPRDARALFYPKDRAGGGAAALECETCGAASAALMAEEATGSPYAA